LTVIGLGIYDTIFFKSTSR